MPLLQTLIAKLEPLAIVGDGKAEIAGIAHDSRKVKKGYLFVAISGFKTDGHRFVEDALSRGAVGVVAEKDISLPPGTTLVRVSNSRSALAMLASEFYDNPTSRLRLIGVTGTKGKTTTTYFIESILYESGYKVGLIGTISYRSNGVPLEAPSAPPALSSTHNTTPESLDLQRMVADMVEAGCTYVAMEVSSHALKLSRVDGCQFDVGVFTNLTQEHFELHGSWDDYLDSKIKLFRSLGSPKKGPKAAIVNVDDPHSGWVMAASSVPVTTYALNNKADITASDINLGLRGTSFRAITPSGDFRVNLKLPGLHNVYNALAAIGVSISEGLSTEAISRGLTRLERVPGRFEFIECGQDFSVVVDFAHAPDALEKALGLAKSFAGRRLITVFGCGGERDRIKRPMMGEVVARYSDYFIITSDNPQSEDPFEIAVAAEEGVKKVGHRNYEIIIDRKKAIEKALRSARRGDIVVLAGKGHETYQMLKDEVVPFNDGEVARSVLRKMNKHSAISNQRSA
jgi:UDP-N-acetylmuramoyl-L-alanyl-D-glutamate--2,6-diaminopimelate ligase